jgi:SAM-dependent methyltransferase
VTVDRDAICQVCGHDTFVHDDVIWPELAHEWELSDEERAHINVQQGTRCGRCGTNVRSQALARALLRVLGWDGTLDAYVATPPSSTSPRVLEINEAGSLAPWLSRLETHRLARYPEYDMRRLPFPDESFDLVVHSDTLEHISEPDKALAECRRVLSMRGACVFTVPVLVGRMTRSRTGLSPSYHGHPGCRDADYRVHTEFGSDVWTGVLGAGFASCEIVPYKYPAGIAVVGRCR